MTTRQLFNYILFSRPFWRIAIVASSLFATIFGLTAPYIQKHFVDRLLGVPPNHHFFDLEYLSIPNLILLTFFFFVFSQGFHFLAGFLGNREAIILQKVLGEKLYLHTLKLRTDSLKSQTSGDTVSLFSTDVPSATVYLEQSLPAGASTLFPLILAPFAIHYFFDIPMFNVILTIGAVILINSFLAYRQSRFFYRFKKLAADRVGMVSEWVQNMRTLRILGWVEEFEKRILEKRKIETVNRVAMVTNGQIMNAISSSVTFFINLIALATLISFKPNASPGDLLALLWIVGVFLTRPFRQMPWFLVFGFDGWTSVTRLSQYFLIKNSGRSFSEDSTSEPELANVGPSIQINNLNLEINHQQILKNMNLEVESGEFIALVGEVGSGKSLLLLSLMGETGATFDRYQIAEKNMLTASKTDLSKHFAFVPQEGFVISSSLRDNVAFTYDSDPKFDSRVLKSLELSSFNIKNENAADGLETEIGERGVNLSGGQKQRVSLARADYFDSPVVLLDDSLSAIDVETESQVIQKLFEGSWKNKTRILATHRLSILNRVNRIVFLEKGQILAQGSFSDLMKNEPKFKEFIEASHEQA